MGSIKADNRVARKTVVIEEKMWQRYLPTFVCVRRILRKFVPLLRVVKFVQTGDCAPNPYL